MVYLYACYELKHFCFESNEEKKIQCKHLDSIWCWNNCVQWNVFFFYTSHQINTHCFEFVLWNLTILFIQIEFIVLHFALMFVCMCVLFIIYRQLTFSYSFFFPYLKFLIYFFWLLLLLWSYHRCILCWSLLSTVVLFSIQLDWQ